MAKSIEDQAAEGLAFVVLMAFVVVTIVVVWAAIKVAELVTRVLVAHPTNKPLWVTLGLFAMTVFAVGLTEVGYTWLNIVCLASLAVLLLTAKAVEIYYDELLQKEWSREALIHEVFHEPWWNIS